MASECVYVCKMGPPLKKRSLQKRHILGGVQDCPKGPLLGPVQGDRTGPECLHVYQIKPLGPFYLSKILDRNSTEIQRPNFNSVLTSPFGQWGGSKIDHIDIGGRLDPISGPGPQNDDSVLSL